MPPRRRLSAPEVHQVLDLCPTFDEGCFPSNQELGKEDVGLLLEMSFGLLRSACQTDLAQASWLGLLHQGAARAVFLILEVHGDAWGLPAGGDLAAAGAVGDVKLTHV